MRNRIQTVVRLRRKVQTLSKLSKVSNRKEIEFTNKKNVPLYYRVLFPFIGDRI